MKLKCLIIDDEPLARKGMEEYVREVDFLSLSGICENPLKANTFLDKGDVDLIFLDIQMPRLSGIDFLKSLKNPPMVVFTTAFQEYALEGYTLDIIDYLVKPISFERFFKAASKAREFYSVRHRGDTLKDSPPDYFFIKVESKYEKVRYDEVLFVEALQNYVILHTPGKKLITYMTMGGMEEQLPSDRFLRVHKSYLVALEKVNAIDGNDIILSGTRIPISRTLKDQVVSRILGNNLLSR